MPEATTKYLNSSKGYFCNMYILKKEIFQKYCSWLFDILETHRKSKSFVIILLMNIVLAVFGLKDSGGFILHIC